MARLQARLNVGRLGATRLGDYYPSIGLFINSLASYRPGGAQGILIDPSLTIDEAEGELASTCQFEMRSATSPPQQGQAVYLTMGSTDQRIFGGQIIRVTQRQNRYGERVVWAVECEDNHRLLNRRLVSATFSAVDAGDIIRTIVSSYTSGFTTTHVAAAMGSVDFIEFTRETVSKAITRTLNRVGGRWRLDASSDIRAWVGSEVGQSPAADISATGKHWGWNHVRDITQVRNKVIVVGAGTTTTTQNPAGSTLIFVSETAMLSSAATISVGRGLYNVASVSASDLGSPFFIVLANSLSAGGLGRDPGGYSGDGSTVAGAPVNVYAVAQSTTYQNSIAAIEGGDGIHEYAIQDGRLTQLGALQRAQAELTIYGPIEHKGAYTTRDPSATIGRLLAVNVASPTNISSVLAKIQRVTVSKFEQSGRSWNSNRTHLFPQRAVQYSSAAVRDEFDILGDVERSGS